MGISSTQPFPIPPPQGIPGSSWVVQVRDSEGLGGGVGQALVPDPQRYLSRHDTQLGAPPSKIGKRRKGWGRGNNTC